MTLDEDMLRKVYEAREIEPHMADEQWRPKEKVIPE